MRFQRVFIVIQSYKAAQTLFSSALMLLSSILRERACGCDCLPLGAEGRQRALTHYNSRRLGSLSWQRHWCVAPGMPPLSSYGGLDRQETVVLSLA